MRSTVHIFFFAIMGFFSYPILSHASQDISSANIADPIVMCSKPKQGPPGPRGPAGPTGPAALTLVPSLRIYSLNGPDNTLNQNLPVGSLITYEGSFQPDPSFFTYTPTAITVLRNGIYEIAALAIGYISQSGEASPEWGIGVIKNGVMIKQWLGGAGQNPTAANRLAGLNIIPLSAGDTLSFGIVSSSSTANNRVSLISMSLVGFPAMQDTGTETTSASVNIKLIELLP